ncbi:MAG: hypothetical protein SGCHY_000304 [Lobulomycetales sp.]
MKRYPVQQQQYSRNLQPFPHQSSQVNHQQQIRMPPEHAPAPQTSRPALKMYSPTSSTSNKSTAKLYPKEGHPRMLRRGSGASSVNEPSSMLRRGSGASNVNEPSSARHDSVYSQGSGRASNYDAAYQHDFEDGYSIAPAESVAGLSPTLPSPIIGNSQNETSRMQHRQTGQVDRYEHIPENPYYELEPRQVGQANARYDGQDRQSEQRYRDSPQHNQRHQHPNYQQNVGLRHPNQQIYRQMPHQQMLPHDIHHSRQPPGISLQSIPKQNSQMERQGYHQAMRQRDGSFLAQNMLPVQNVTRQGENMDRPMHHQHTSPFMERENMIPPQGGMRQNQQRERGWNAPAQAMIAHPNSNEMEITLQAQRARGNEQNVERPVGYPQVQPARQVINSDIRAPEPSYKVEREHIPNIQFQTKPNQSQASRWAPPMSSSEHVIGFANRGEGYMDSPPSSASSSVAPIPYQEQRQPQPQPLPVSYAPKSYAVETSRFASPASPPMSVEEREPPSKKYQRERDPSTPVTIKLFVDDTPIQRMLIFPSAPYETVNDLIQKKCNKYYSRTVEIGKICYADTNGDLVRVVEEDDWVDCKYDLREELYIRLDLIDVVDGEAAVDDLVDAYA